MRRRRTVYLFHGHDEEVGGRNGAVQAAALLRQRGVRLDFVSDERIAVERLADMVRFYHRL
jgi:carboxypeptidase PM20D1